MIPNCGACEIEFLLACEYVEEGLHLVQSEETNLGVKGKHLMIKLVDEKGKVVVE